MVFSLNDAPLCDGLQTANHGSRFPLAVLGRPPSK
jgi:hypothetical protein